MVDLCSYSHRGRLKEGFLGGPENLRAPSCGKQQFEESWGSSRLGGGHRADRELGGPGTTPGPPSQSWLRWTRLSSCGKNLNRQEMTTCCFYIQTFSAQHSVSVCLWVELRQPEVFRSRLSLYLLVPDQNSTSHTVSGRFLSASTL